MKLLCRKEVTHTNTESFINRLYSFVCFLLGFYRIPSSPLLSHFLLSLLSILIPPMSHLAR